MFHFIFKKSIIVISLFLLSISFSQAQEKTLDDIVSDIKRGSDIEKLEASKLIVPFGLEGKRAVRSLRKLVGKEKDPKNAAVYLSALLAITDDHSRAYKAFTKNGKSQKGKKYEKVRKTTAFFRALGDVSPVPDSLLPYINSLRDDKKVSYVAVNGALAGLVNNNPNMLVKIMDRLDTDPLNTIRILRNVELGLDPYFSKVIGVLNKAPFDGMELLIKHNKLDDEVIDFAVSKAVIPKKDNNRYFFSNRRTSWNAALDILVLSEKTSVGAQQKLIELLNSSALNDVQDAFARHPNISEELERERESALFTQLVNPEFKVTDRSNPKYQFCLHISDLKIQDEANVNTLLNVAKFTDNTINRMVCTYALKSVVNPPQEVIDHLESSLDVNLSNLLSKSNALLNRVNSEVNQMQTIKFTNAMAPDMKSLYAAYVLLKNNPEHVKALAYVEELYDANVPGELEKTEEFGAEILKLCVEVGGVLTGEHGVGVEKRDLMPEMFTEDDLNQQQRVKCAFDPDGLLNPGKVFPQLHRCAELGRMHIHKGQVPFPDLPRF